MSRLLSKLHTARTDGTREWDKLLTTLKKPDLLILDDFGLDRLDATHSRDLLEIVEDRQETGSIIITAQLPVLEWHGIFDDATVADAALDRIIHGSFRIELRGPSRRAAALPGPPVAENPDCGVGHG
jgi:DNA replication protein DnaC